MDGEIQRTNNKLDLSLTNLDAAIRANTSSLNSMAYLIDTGWQRIPWTLIFGDYVRDRWRVIGGMVNVDVKVEASYAVGNNTVLSGVTGPWLPDVDRHGLVRFYGGYMGVATFQPGGTIIVTNQTGATRDNAEFLITYPLTRT